VDVVDIGVVPTPALYWSVHNLGVVGGIQITGSHNPPEYNGFKLGIGPSSLYGAQIQRIYQLASSGEFVTGAGTVRREAVIDRYVDDIVARIGPISRPLKVVADAGNGAGALVARQLLDRLGLTSARCLYCESDGTFPNHHPDPTVPENVRDLIAAVREDGADIGVAFDGDADRIGVVDEHGEIIWGDYLLILYARDVLRRTGRGSRSSST
jgi:phosphomannomutase/phosphoglucomutase